MKAGDIIHMKEYPEGYFDATIESVATHSQEGYEYTSPIARVCTEEGEYIAAVMEHDLIRERDGVWWER